MAVIKKFRIKSFKKKNSIIEFENVSLSYGNRLILDNISFKINEGQIFGMLGPNGVGKSTIFNLITGLINPKHGKIKINGQEIEAEKYIFNASKNPKDLGPFPEYTLWYYDDELIKFKFKNWKDKNRVITIVRTDWNNN